MDPDIPWYGARALRNRIVEGEISPVEATEAALARAASIGAQLHAFVALDPEGARASALEAERALSTGVAPGPLHGVPITIKDLLLTRGVPTTAGSRAVDGLPQGRDATLVRRLRRAGAVIIGKTNLNEVAYGITGENAHFGDVLNPWDPGRMPGGSSSGTAAALATGIGYGSVGTDTRGSIRIPASCCSVTGLKPTRGLLPTEGVFPLSRTLDHPGPMARSAEDTALLMDVMAGARGTAAPFTSALGGPLEGLRLGLVSFFFEDLDEQVADAVRQAVEVLAGAGMVVRDMEIAELEGSLRASGVIAAAEALDVHDERLRERREGFGSAVLARLDAAYANTALDLVRAQALRERMLDAYHRAFHEVDLMVGPTLPGLPAPVGSATMRVGGGREEGIVDASCRLVAPQNMTGVPAASLPCGFSREGLPIGLQIWAASGADHRVLAAAHQYQERTDWHRRRPPLAPGEVTTANPARRSPPGSSA